MAVNSDREKAIGDFKGKVHYCSKSFYSLEMTADLSGRSKAPRTQGMGCKAKESTNRAQGSAKGVQPYRG